MHLPKHCVYQHSCPNIVTPTFYPRKKTKSNALPRLSPISDVHPSWTIPAFRCLSSCTSCPLWLSSLLTDLCPPSNVERSVQDAGLHDKHHPIHETQDGRKRKHLELEKPFNHEQEDAGVCRSNRQSRSFPHRTAADRTRRQLMATRKWATTFCRPCAPPAR
jgi:hypothetical protein